MQTNYDMYPKKALAGLIGDTSPHTIDSFIAEGDIYAGVPLVRGTDEKTVKVAKTSADAQNVFAIAAFGYKSSTNKALYNTGDVVAVLRRGKIYVPVSGSVSAGAKAKVVIENGKALFAQTGYELGIDIIFESTSDNGLALVTI